MSTSVCTSDDDNCKKGKQLEWVQFSSSAVVFVGAICGQVFMGMLDDKLLLFLSLYCIYLYYYYYYYYY
jgi:uncharacterized membrane protein YoaK (UPF0700 family)